MELEPKMPVEMPSFQTMALELTDALKQSLSGLATKGVLVVSDSKYTERIQVCEVCEFFDKMQFRCGKCGCYMKMKARLDASKCPEAKW